MGPLVTLFRTNGGIYPVFQSQAGSTGFPALSPLCDRFLRFIFVGTSANLLVASMAANPLFQALTGLKFTPQRVAGRHSN